MKVRKLSVIASVAALAVSALIYGVIASANTTVVVRPSNTQGWSTADTRPGGAVNYVADATAPGGGSGALQLTTDGTNAAKAQYMHAATTPLAGVTTLSYFTKQVSGPAHADPSYQLVVCLSGVGPNPTPLDPCGGPGFATLVFEPYWNDGLPSQPPAVVPGAWQQWDVDAGQFWSSRTYTAGSCAVVNGAGGPPFYSLNGPTGLKASCPNAVAIGFGVNVGTFNPNYNVYADLVQYNDTTYNFEVTGPSVLVVDDDNVECPTASYTSIQAAVNASLAGDTIQVCAGTYNENVNVPASRTGLTLQGAQAGNPVGGRTFGSPVEATVNGQVTIQAANVTFGGFSLTRSVPAFAAFGIVVAPGADGAAITENIIDTVTSPDPSGNGTAQAIYLSNESGGDGPDNVTIIGNRINNIHSNRSAKGVLIGVNGATNPSTNTLIKSNVIQNVTSDTRGAYGVSVANTPGVSGLVVQDNTFTSIVGTLGWAHAVGLEGDTPGANVVGNVFTNVTDGSPLPVPDAAAVFFEANPSYPTVEVHNNQFNVGPGSFGMAVHANLIAAFPSATADGECNWWGASNGPGPVGPGSGALVSTNVDYSPWQTAPNGACVGPDGDGDGVTDAADNCPNAFNPNQENADNDAQGDACDPDDDNDGIPDTCDVDQTPGPDVDMDGIIDGSGCDTNIGPPINKDQCKDGGWALYNVPRKFKNQGDCVQYVNTGK